MKQEGYNQEIIQAKNRALILQFLQQEQLCSRVQLAQLSGLKQATITNIINDFLSWGIVEEMGPINGQRGRKAVAIRLEQEHFGVIGVRLSRQYFEAGIFTLRGRLTGEKTRIPITDSSPRTVISKMREVIRNLEEAAGSRHILTVGVAVPGPYYHRIGKIEDVFPGWDQVNFQEELQEGLSLPVIIEHDANAGVLAECVLGNYGPKYNTVVYLAVGQGIGAGVYHNGQVFRGSAGIAGEIGHISLNPAGPVCTCGNRGCLTAYASTIALTGRINRARKEKNPSSEDLVWQDLTKEEYRSNPSVLNEIQQNNHYLATGINNLIYIYDPDLIIIGDEILALGNEIAEDISNSLTYLKRHAGKENVVIRTSSFSMDSAFIGAAEIAIDYVFHNLHVFQAV